uniref:C2H2-type domain-containing protein n=1 Tax=Trichobilharzia regenti TaxID=157069 RepID=A0AA85JSA1_TRIRE|nr:unnamed protein product [Trichobilharzia regenti]
MTSELLRIRNPLSEKQSENNGDASNNSSVIKSDKSDSDHHSNLDNSSAIKERQCSPNSPQLERHQSISQCSVFPSTIMNNPCPVKSTSPPKSVFPSLGQIDLNKIWNICEGGGGGFRYQIRRPVEPWKYYESRKSDGSKVYLCRLCGSSYKHKKSLNKHWRDKHYSELMKKVGGEDNPAVGGDIDNGDGDGDGDGDEGDGDDAECDVDGDDCVEGDAKTMTTSSNGPLSSIENIGGNKANSRYTNTPASLGTIHSMGDEDCENRPPNANNVLSGYGVVRSQNFVDDCRDVSVMRGGGGGSGGVGVGGDMMALGRSGRVSAPMDFRDRLFVCGRRRLSVVPCSSSPSDQGRVHKRISECGVKRVRSPMDGSENVNMDSKRRHSVFPSVRDGCYSDMNEKDPEVSTKNIGDSELVSSGPSQFDVSSVDVCEGGVSGEGMEPLDLSVMKPLNTGVIECVLDGRVSGGSSECSEGRGDLSKRVNGEGSCSVKTCEMETVSGGKFVSSVEDGSGSRKKSTRISRSLLIGLLETAVNIVKNEVDENVGDSMQLSATCSSLLLAIGSLLVRLGEKRLDVSSDCPRSESFQTSNVSVGEGGGVRSVECRSDLSGVGVLNTMNMRDFGQVSVDHFPPSRDNALHDGSVGDSGLLTNDSGVVNVEISRSTRNDKEEDDDRCVGTGTCVGKWDGEFTRSSESHHAGDVMNEKEIWFKGMSEEVSFSGEDGMKKSDLSESTFICPVCKFRARWFSELRAHMVNHSEHRMFGCCYCQYRAKWKWDVAKHIRRCPLGRHVSHLPNEALLRIVKYHAPRQGDILYGYFPQRGFPGVGVDHPPTPPSSVMNHGYERLGNEGVCESGDDVGVNGVTEYDGVSGCEELMQDEERNKCDSASRVEGKCPLCEFHSTDKTEFQLHWNSHCPYME